MCQITIINATLNNTETTLNSLNISQTHTILNNDSNSTTGINNTNLSTNVKTTLNDLQTTLDDTTEDTTEHTTDDSTDDSTDESTEDDTTAAKDFESTIASFTTQK